MNSSLKRGIVMIAELESMTVWCHEYDYDVGPDIVADRDPRRSVYSLVQTAETSPGKKNSIRTIVYMISNSKYIIDS